MIGGAPAVDNLLAKLGTTALSLMIPLVSGPLFPGIPDNEHYFANREHPSYEDQRHRASGLNLVVAAIVLWNTVYLARAVEELRNQGMGISEDLLQRLSPLGWEHIILTGDYVWDLRQGTTLDRLRSLRKKSSL